MVPYTLYSISSIAIILLKIRNLFKTHSFSPSYKHESHPLELKFMLRTLHQKATHWSRSTRNMTTMTDIIKRKLSEGLKLSHLELVNESGKHSGPATESHFKVLVVSDDFEGKTLIQRHRTINSILEMELKQEGGIHALSIDAKTPAQYSKKPEIHQTPPCAGGHD